MGDPQKFMILGFVKVGGRTLMLFLDYYFFEIKAVEEGVQHFEPKGDEPPTSPDVSDKYAENAAGLEASEDLIGNLAHLSHVSIRVGNG